MRFTTLVGTFGVLLNTTYGWDSSSSIIMTLPPTSSYPATCPTSTQTGGSGCPMVTPPSGGGCTIEACMVVSTITPPCDCPVDLASTTFCETTCHQGCQTSWSILHPPCPTSPTSNSSTSSTSTPCTGADCSTTSSSTSSTNPPCTGVDCSTTTSSTTSSTTLPPCTDASCSSTTSATTLPPCTDASCTSSSTTLPPYSNSTVTITTITTLTTCPYHNTCHGQTTTWTGTVGPFPCSARPTCTCVLPGGSGTTITGPTTTTQVTTVGTGGASSTSTSSSARSTSTGTLQSSGGERMVAEGWVGMIFAGLLGFL